MAASLQQFGFLLCEAYSPLALVAATEALHAVNSLIGRDAYEVAIVQGECSPTPADLPGDRYRMLRLDDAQTLSALVVVAGQLPRNDDPSLAPVGQLLMRVAARGGTIGGIGTGACWLAHAGLLRGYRCTLDAHHAQLMAEQFPECIVSSNLYELDRTRVTCAGHTASLDMMIAWLSRNHGERFVHGLLVHFGLEHLRPSGQRQRSALASGHGPSTKLAEAVSLMENNIREPLSTEEIAGLVGVSRRQLERLFKQHLDALPSRWYLEQRLHRARDMLKQGSQSILQVGLSCGFSSGAHFSNAYRAYFNRSPRDERSARAAEWRSQPSEGAPSPTADNPPEDQS